MPKQLRAKFRPPYDHDSIVHHRPGWKPAIPQVGNLRYGRKVKPAFFLAIAGDFIDSPPAFEGKMMA